MIEITICERCKGKGTNENRELIDYHRGEYNSTYMQCPLCKGSGRMKKTTTVTIEPYQP
jgi:DnaJ-class molecular chaperone